MKLVINGDDLGYTKANTLGIVCACTQGILRSTTALANSAYLEFAARQAAACPGLGVGVHLTLTLGRPLTQGRSFTGAGGSFLSRRALATAPLDYEEVRAEWTAQVERFIEVFGCKPTHLDSHHSVHDMTPEALATAREVAGEYGLELRRYSRFAYVGGFYDVTATEDVLLSLLAEHAGEDIEIMCHPGFCDLELYRGSSYNVQRVRELDVLCSPRVQAYVEENGIELCHY